MLMDGCPLNPVFQTLRFTNESNNVDGYIQCCLLDRPQQGYSSAKVHAQVICWTF